MLAQKNEKSKDKDFFNKWRIKIKNKNKDDLGKCEGG